MLTGEDKKLLPGVHVQINSHEYYMIYNAGIFNQQPPHSIKKSMMDFYCLLLFWPLFKWFTIDDYFSVLFGAIASEVHLY